MKTLIRLVTATTLFTLTTSASGGVNLELTDEELFEEADLVADVRVSDTVCDGEPVETEHSTTTNYASTLELLDVLKGSAEGTATYTTAVNEYTSEAEQPSCEEPEIVLPAGWVGRLYLGENPDGNYRLQYFDGAQIDQAESVQEELPECSAQSHNQPGDPVPTDDVVNLQEGCSVSGSGTANGFLALGLIGLALGLGRRRRA